MVLRLKNGLYIYFLWMVTVFVSVILPQIAFAKSCVVDFLQKESSIEVVLDVAFSDVSYLVLPNVPAYLEIDLLKRQSKRVDLEDGILRIEFTTDEPDDGEYSILVFVGNDWFELVRQSSEWLENKFSFKRLGGYTILGRRSVEIYGNLKRNLSPLKLNKKPYLDNIQAAGESKFKEVRIATGLLWKLWSTPLRSGPIDMSYREFLGHTLEEKLEFVRDGKFSVQCQGFRDLFIHASEGIQDLQVRAIEAYNYTPQFSDLISYGHSTLEIWIDSIEKWVLFDPWLAIMVYHNGMPVGAGDLHRHRSIDNPSRYVVFPLIDTIERKFLSDKAYTSYDFFPSSVSLDRFTCKDIGCSPGYTEYFYYFFIREYEIVE